MTTPESKHRDAAAPALAPWFFAEHIPEVGETATLDATEAAHATKARRKNIREPITLIDGRGRIADCRIASIEARIRSLNAVVLNIRDQPQHAPAVHIATALPKGDRASTMLSMLTQLGVRDITPLRTEHSVVRPSDNFTDRALRICAEACKQSRNAWLPNIHPHATLAEVIDRHPSTTKFFAHPIGTPLTTCLNESDASEFLICIGPEGGFSENECNAASEHMTSVRLGSTILRIETAAVVAATIARMMQSS